MLLFFDNSFAYSESSYSDHVCQASQQNNKSNIKHNETCALYSKSFVILWGKVPNLISFSCFSQQNSSFWVWNNMKWQFSFWLFASGSWLQSHQWMASSRSYYFHRWNWIKFLMSYIKRRVHPKMKNAFCVLWNYSFHF